MNALALQPGSFPWLLAHDIRLGWRGFLAMFGKAGPLAVWGMLAAAVVVTHVIAWPAVTWLAPRLEDGAQSLAPLSAVILCSFTWMTAQSLFSASRTLYARGDLDLLLGSPLPARHVFAAKAGAIAAGSFGSVALLLLPLANVGALVDGPAWLGIYPALVSLALIATALGLSLTILLFRLVGPSRARLWTQMTGAVIAGAFVLGVQVAAMLPVEMRAGITAWLEAQLATDGSGPMALLRLPLDTVRGSWSAAARLTAFAAVTFAAAAFVLGRHFASVSLAAVGAGSHGGRRWRAPGKPRFKSGLARSLRRKEWRLLVRDPGMFAQLSLQIIYTVPVAVVLLKSESLPPVFALAPTIVVIAAQVAASLAWITVSGEDAPELIATAPVTRAAVDRSKLVSVALPVSAILALPLLALAMVSWWAALVTAAVAAAGGASTALVNFWHPMPGNRRGMLRRHSQSKLVALIEHVLALLWAVVIVMAMMGTWLAVVPAFLVVAVLAAVARKSHRVSLTTAG